MKNSELLAKYKKEGIESLTDHECRRLANIAWKEDAFSLNGLVKYVQSTNDVFINAILKRVGINKDVITVAWILKHADKTKLVKSKKDEKTGKLVPTEEKKQFFGMWLISGTILNFGAEIKAKAQSSQPAKVKQPEKTEVEKQAENVKKTAAKVAANKRRVEEIKKSKAKKTTKTAKAA